MVKPKRTGVSTLVAVVSVLALTLQARAQVPPPGSLDVQLFRVASSDAGQLELSGSQEWRLAPNAYIEAQARLALSQGDVPSAFRFRASELRSISIPRANHVGALKLTLELPSPGAMPYSLLHLAMMDEVRARFFVTLGQGWTTLDELGTTSPSIEAGMEQIIELSTLGGLLSLTARIGVAIPVAGEGLTTLYGSVSF